jgi:hypothetical protein
VAKIRKPFSVETIGLHTAGSCNCMVRAADTNVCGRAACSRRQREKRDAKSGELWPLGSDTRARDRGHGFWPVPTEGCCGVQTLEAVHMVARGCLVVMMQLLCAKRLALIGPYLQISCLHQDRDLTSPASDDAEGPGSTWSAVWHNLLADWESNQHDLLTMCYSTLEGGGH